MELISREEVLKIIEEEVYIEECEFDDGDCVVCEVCDKEAMIKKIMSLATVESRPNNRRYER